MPPAQPASPRTADPVENTAPGPRGISRRHLLRTLLFALVGAPVALRLGETAARAERRRQHHRGDDSGIWIGHC